MSPSYNFILSLAPAARRLRRHPLCERTRTGHVSPRFVKKKNTVDKKIEEEKNQTIKKNHL